MKKGLRRLVDGHQLNPSLVRTLALMKKGLRLDRAVGYRTAVPGSDSCPDEEGIKTTWTRGHPPARRSDSCPDEEGIKTRLRRTTRPRSRVRTLALMKKGLRRRKGGARQDQRVRTLALMKKGLRRRDRGPRLL